MIKLLAKVVTKWLVVDYDDNDDNDDNDNDDNDNDDNDSDNDDNDSDYDVINDDNALEPAQPDADVEAGDPWEGWHQDPDRQHRGHHLRPPGLRHPRGRGPGVRPGHQVRHDD